MAGTDTTGLGDEIAGWIIMSPLLLMFLAAIIFGCYKLSVAVAESAQVVLRVPESSPALQVTVRRAQWRHRRGIRGMVGRPGPQPALADAGPTGPRGGEPAAGLVEARPRRRGMGVAVPVGARARPG